MRRDGAGDPSVATRPGPLADPFEPYLPRLAVEWPAASGPQWREIDGTLVFADVSGFTSLSERLARRGRAGAEEVTDVIGGCFERLLDRAREDGGSLLKFGGDALLLAFTDARHANRACRAASRMRREMRSVGALRTSVGHVRLRISIGVHTGPLHVFRVGESHRELVITGPGATATVAMEHGAKAGEIVMSPSTAAHVHARLQGPAKGPGRLLRDVEMDLGGGISTPGAEAGHVGDSASAIPLALRAHLAAGAIEPEHRIASIAFLRYEQVDSLLADSGAAAVAAALDDLVRVTQRAADEEDVTFLTSDIDTDGGKLILVSGVPVSRDDDEGRLLRAVRRIADATHALPVRIGVNRGSVFVGEIGPSYRRTFTVMGDAVNVAARLMAAAGAGQVFASLDVVERSRVGFHHGPLAPLVLKGKSAAVEACVLGAPTGRSRASDEPAGGRLPLVGRDAELATISEALASAQAGAGAVLEIVGEAGIGKSRLVDEAASRADVARITVASERYERSTPYYSIGRLLRVVLDVGDLDGAALGDTVRDRVSAEAPTLLPWLPLLAVPLGFDMGPTPETAELEPRFRRQRTSEVTVELLSALVPHPALLAFEDAQWMDAASADVLAHLSTTVGDWPWAVCILRREDSTSSSVSSAPRGPRTRVLPLGPVPADAAAEAVVIATDDAPLLPHDAAALVERAGGNPLYLGELLRSRRDSADEMPDTLEGVVSIQVDRLPPRARRLLRFAAVLGTTFSRPLLTALAGDDPDADPLAELDGLGGFVEADTADRFRFRTPLTRDVIYQSLSFRRRQELHSLAADAIERARHASTTDQAEVLSVHLLAASRHADAWHYAVLAARRAQAKYANVDAAELYERALSAARHLPDLAASELAEVWEALGDVREMAGAYDDAAAAYGAARRLVGNELDRAALFLKTARVAVREGRYSSGLTWARRGLRLLDGIEGAEVAARRAGLSAWYATVRQRQGHHKDAVRWANEAIRQATEGNDDQDALAQAYRVLDWAYVDLGRLDLAVHSDAALEIYEQRGDLSGQAEVLNNLGGFAYYQGRWDDALRFYSRSRDTMLRTGNAVDAAAATANMAEVLADQGRLDDADAGFREALHVWRASGYGRWVAFATMHLGRIAARRGDFERALRLFEEARAGFAAIDGAAEVLETDVWTAECLLLKGDSERALALVDDGLAREAAMGGAGVHRATLHRLRGYACASLCRLVESWASLDDSLAAARSRQAHFEVALTLEAFASIAPLAGLPFDPPEEEHRLVLERLGVRHLPVVPLPMPVDPPG